MISSEEKQYIGNGVYAHWVESKEHGKEIALTYEEGPTNIFYLDAQAIVNLIRYACEQGVVKQK